MSSKNKGIAKANKEERRLDAEARNGAWRAMSHEHQLADLDSRGLTATKQRARIAAAMKRGSKA